MEIRFLLLVSSSFCCNKNVTNCLTCTIATLRSRRGNPACSLLVGEADKIIPLSAFRSLEIPSRSKLTLAQGFAPCSFRFSLPGLCGKQSRGNQNNLQYRIKKIILNSVVFARSSRRERRGNPHNPCGYGKAYLKKVDKRQIIGLSPYWQLFVTICFNI